MLYVHIQKIKPKEKIRGTQKEKSEDKAIVFVFGGVCFFLDGSKGLRFSVYFALLTTYISAGNHVTTTVMMIMVIMTLGNGGECNYVHTWKVHETAPVYPLVYPIYNIKSE